MTFLEKFELLKKSIPVPAITIGPNTVECEYSDAIYIGKNCYHCFDGYKIFDSMFTNFGWGNKVVDCEYVTESEKVYECVECTKCYNSTFLIDCNNSTDCHFSSLLNSCSDCFGCVGLTHKKYCIFNRQYSKEEYLKKVEELKKQEAQKNLKQMLEIKQTIPHPASQQANNENCAYGNYIYGSKNCYWCFNTYYSENSGFTYFSGAAKNCWDMFQAGGQPDIKIFSELCYENVYTDTCYNSAYLTFSDNCTNCSYSDHLLNCTDCFGCVGLKNKKCCILNNQLNQVQYEKAVKSIKNELGWKN